MQTLLGKHWHHLSAEEVVTLLDSDAQRGLDVFESEARLARFGSNRLKPRPGRKPWQRFLDQLNDPLILILLGSSVITAIVKDWVDAIIILGVVLINALIGYLQEARAEESIAALARATITEATVLRAGQERRIDSTGLVPGDIVVLRSGDRTPADLRLVRTRDLQIAEASLTGESAPVEKNGKLSLAPETVLADRANMAYASTLVTYGQGVGVVTATGENTEIGRISQMIVEATKIATPLTQKMASLSRMLMVVILILAAAAFALGVWRGDNLVDTLIAAIALAVAMIPEGLPAALTVTLAIGVARMARRRAIIRKLPAVETLGSVTVICSDKTGTLTQNEMTVQEAIVAGEPYRFSGVGYDPTGTVEHGSAALNLAEAPGLEAGLAAGALCNDSNLWLEDGAWQRAGDPTEIALLTAAYKAGLDVAQLRERRPRLDSIPFESQNQFMATLNGAPGSQPDALVKGALEVVLARCDFMLSPAGERLPLDRSLIEDQAQRLAAQGMRVLALAHKPLPAGTDQLALEDVAGGLTLLGLQAMIDPPRSEAKEAIRLSQQAGITVKMITGDHALTATAIAGQLGLIDGASGAAAGRTLTGGELAALSDRELIQAAQQVNVFARVSPEQKLRLVRALQANGEIVAMTGDGVNDGPALKQADIGVAMGQSGSEVAKEAADMALTDDNFATIAAAVEEGRGIYDNLTKIIAWTLPTNIGQGLIILAALLVGAALPILPIQVLWINMISVGVLGLVLALEPREPGLMRRPPRRPNAPVLDGVLFRRTLLVGLLILIGAFGMFEYELLIGAPVAVARTAAVNAVIVIGIFYLLNTRSLTDSMFTIGLFSNRWVWIGIAVMSALQLAFTYIPFMNRALYSAPLDLDAWLRILGFGLFTYFLVEGEKWLRRRKAPAPATRR